MTKEINPKNSSRAMAFELWMKAPNPMVTFFKTLDVTNLLTVSRKKELKLNMLITGASHTGKTLLAQRMLEQYKYPYLSIDHLKMGLIRSGNTELTPLSDDKALTAYLWPIVREMIKTAIENDQYLIIEGCYIPFYWRRDFDDRYLSSIRFICLAMTDEYIKSHFDVIIRHESDIESRLIESDITIDGLIAENHRMIEGFQSTGEQVILISSDYEQNITELLATDVN